MRWWLHTMRIGALRRSIAAMLAVGLLIAGVPVAISAPQSGSRTLSLSADICHPLQSFVGAASSVPFARPSALVRECAASEFERAPEYTPAALYEIIFTPDPPPPKAVS